MHKKQQRLYTMFIFMLGIVVFLSLFLVFFISANWPAIQNEITYAYAQIVPPPPSPVLVVENQPTPPVATPEPIHEPAHIIIEKIGVDAPVQWDIEAEATLGALNHGVAHLKGTAALGQVGNIFITGHSSDYSWKKNPYAAVFSLLPKLTVGDTIALREHGKEYVYKVTHTKIVKPDQVDVANATRTPFLTLMTCYPIGTTQERFIVQAALVSAPDKITARTQPNHNIVAPNQFR